MKLLALALTVLGAAALHGQPIQFQTQELPWAIVGTSYSAIIETVVDGRCLSSGGLILALAGGTLPHGMMLRGESLTGTPTAVGRYRFAIRAGNLCAADEREFDLIVSGRPILRAVPEELVYEYKIGGPDPQPQNVLVTGTWPNLPYSVRADKGPWVIPEQAQGMTPDRGSAFAADEITVRVNPDKLVAGVYRSTLVIATWQGANAPRIPVTLRVTE